MLGVNPMQGCSNCGACKELESPEHVFLQCATYNPHTETKCLAYLKKILTLEEFKPFITAAFLIMPCFV